MMTPDQAKRALALLRSLHADIEAMRSTSDRLEFTGFAGRAEEDNTLTIDWPNLAILNTQVDEFLKEINVGKWGVWCGVSGGVTGRREAWLTANGQRVRYATKEEAEAEARRLLGRDGMRFGGGASFTYTAREIDA